MTQIHAFTLLSPAFEDGGEIPKTYTCDGEGISPPLTIECVPEGTQSLALIVEDPDVPTEVRAEGEFDHWIVYNISPETELIEEGEIPPEAREGMNTAGNEGYMGPCPPKEYEPVEHRYVFTLYALNTQIDHESGVTKDVLHSYLEDHIIEETTLTGRYRKE